MKFIEMTGKTLKDLIADDELHADDLSSAGVVRRHDRAGQPARGYRGAAHDRWDVIGGLLGNYEQRIKQETGLDWAE